MINVILGISLIIVAVIAIRALRKSHINWLKKQSPVGTWEAKDGRSVITLHFQQSAESVNEGLYYQLIKTENDKELREFGHWTADCNTLAMLIMASDAEGEDFGIDREYFLLYTGSERIKIDGPGRPNLTYTKQPDGSFIPPELGSL